MHHLLLALLLFVFAADDTSLAQSLRDMTAHLDRAESAAEAGDVGGARAAYQQFVDGWRVVEDDVRPRSHDAYESIEAGMREVRTSLNTTPFDKARAAAAIETLDKRVDAFVGTLGAGGAVKPSEVAPAARDVGGLVALLDRTREEIEEGEAQEASETLAAFRRDWPGVEGDVKARSAAVYERTEDRMADAAAMLASSPPRLAEADQVVGAMRADLASVEAQATHYGPIDVAIILLREGLEALLVVGALLAFLRRTGNADKAGWIWAGGALGVALSVAVALVINLLFAQAAGSNRELIEGGTGLVAAAMLVYVSYWLHSKSSLGAWQRYISAKSSAALARGSLASLALISFLAVFREGAETVLFYVGIAPGVSTTDLALGLAAGAIGLAIIGVAMLLFGMRLPIRPFFLVSSALIYYLAFKFVGTGIHALQVAGVVDAHTAPYLPSFGALGVFPTWETTVAQLLLLAVALVVLITPRLSRFAPSTLRV